MPRHFALFFLIPCLCLTVISSAVAAEANLPAGEKIDYLTQVKPILQGHCVSCHGPLKQESGLRVDAASLLLSGGERGPAVVPGKSAKSLLISALHGQGEVSRMPMEAEPLSGGEVALLARWIDQGALHPTDEPITRSPREHWAFNLPVQADVPQSGNGWARNPLDQFIARQHERVGLTPLAEASRQVLLRRVYLDLVGVPPTRAQLDAFLSDKSPQAYEHVVDELLDSSLYGQRWSRHWMDVWRYSDWAGYRQEVRNSQPDIWRWRDWIVESLNADKPYDRMLVEMLAGDEVAPGDPQTQRATGFLVRNWFKFNRNVWLQDTVDHTAKAFLGVTLNCARCHDHKYDPIPQTAYYEFRAIFEPQQVRTDLLPGENGPQEAGVVRAYDQAEIPPTYLFDRGNEAKPLKDNPLSPAVPEILGGKPYEVHPVELSNDEAFPHLRPFMLKHHRGDVHEKASKLQAELDKLNPEKEPQRAIDRAKLKLAVAQAEEAFVESRIAAELALRDQLPQAERKALADAACADERELARVKAELELQEARQKHLEFTSKLEKAKQEAGDEPNEEAQKKLTDLNKGLETAAKTLKTKEDALAKAEATCQKPSDGKYTPLGTAYPSASTGRRLALARWIADRQNPLTARVAVNHIWMRHFGEPLVASVFDFGLNGTPPTHPELLDWLAVEFMNQGWSTKWLHRLIVTSSTYRLASGSAGQEERYAADSALDRDNRWCWRFRVRRMEAEAVRDSLLHVAGNLDLTPGGADLDHAQGQSINRRSLYFRHAHEKQMLMMTLFDTANVNECYRRVESIVPQQALALANSPLCLEQSRLLAQKLWKELQGSEEATDKLTETFIMAAFKQILTREATTEELTVCREFLASQASLLSEPGKLTAFASGASPETAAATTPEARARENLIHVLLNHNDFITIR